MKRKRVAGKKLEGEESKVAVEIHIHVDASLSLKPIFQDYKPREDDLVCVHESTATDLYAIIDRLQKQVCTESGAKTSFWYELDSILSCHSNQRLLVARRRGEVLGYLAYTQELHLTDERCCCGIQKRHRRCAVRFLEVWDEHRKTGVGRLLVQALESKIELHTHFSFVIRVAARAFWEKLGYTVQSCVAKKTVRYP